MFMTKFTILVVLVLVSSWAPVEGCPVGCNCAPRTTGTVAACVNQNLESIPKSPPFPENTEQIYIKGNSIKRIKLGDFDNLPRLRTLVLTQCKIQSIEPNAFSQLTHLGALNLDWNRINEIQANTFSGLHHLKQLNLNNNDLKIIHDFGFQGLNLTRLSFENNGNLTDISDHTFHGARIHYLSMAGTNLHSKSLHSLKSLSSSLRQLHLESNKKPLTIPVDLFKGFDLDQVYLNNNGLTEQNFLQHLTCSNLELANNPLGVIDFSRYPSLQNIRNLFLTNTQFSTVHPKYFQNMTHLRQLSLANNAITTFPESMGSVFKSLNRLIITNNYIHCNCELIWFKEWMRYTDTIVIGGKCRTPRNNSILEIPEDIMICTPPSFTNILESVNISTANPLSLKCIAKGDPPPTILWETPSGEILTNTPPRNRVENENVGELIIKNTKEENAGLYKCIASNKAGNITAMAHVDVYHMLPLTAYATHPHIDMGLFLVHLFSISIFAYL